MSKKRTYYEKEPEIKDYFSGIFNEIKGHLFNNMLLTVYITNEKEVEKLAYKLLKTVIYAFIDQSEWQDEKEDLPQHQFFMAIRYHLGKDFMSELSNELEEAFIKWAYENNYITKKEYEAEKWKFV